jgi:hypothetical protein
VLGEAAGFFLAVDEAAVGDDVEDSAAAFDELGGDACFGFDCIRQTGGLGEVVSLYAVGDGNLHICFLRLGWIMSALNGVIVGHRYPDSTWGGVMAH